MLEIKDLKKFYKTKSGSMVKALNGVTLRFPECGMVFLLGKSGSGKSTLLNVCGGLDTPTDGEIIIKGRSSKNFTQSDFDSYRNTFVGFVFQEYNILNEFSVENNIALALELQGKEKSKEKIEKILKDVDLEGYGKRKPNTLSGGQKQRIAIARALIKDPEIIMADEPTGALDSNTGKQVFDTLKKLSKDKLVLVVSHDREFAETYADRIIELKDGKVISDISKEERKQEQLNSNISIVGENVICIKDGENLEDNDFKFIKNFLKKNRNAMICSGEKDVIAFKKVARINDNGCKEVFNDTDESKIVKKQYNEKDAKFISSKLPMKHAFTIGVSGLKSKPFRLIVTSLLCTFAFVLFGLLSTMMLYNGDAVFKESMTKSDYTRVKAMKQYQINSEYYFGNKFQRQYSYMVPTRMTKGEIADLSQTFGNDTFGIKTFNGEVQNIYSRPNEYSYYKIGIQGVAVVDKDNSILNDMIGEYPKEINQIAISSYLASSIVENGLRDIKNDVKYNIDNIEDVIGKTIKVNNVEYVVTGIFKSEEISLKYDTLKQNGDYDWDLVSSFNQELSEGIHQIVLVTEERLNEVNLNDEIIWNMFNGLGNMMVEFNRENNYYQHLSYGKYSNIINGFNVNYFDQNDVNVEDNEIILSSFAMYQIIENNYQKLSSIYQNKWNNWEDYENSLSRKAYQLLIENVDNTSILSVDTKEAYKKELINFINESGVLNFDVKSYNMYDGVAVEDFEQKVKVVGYFESNEYELAIVSDKFFDTLNQTIIDLYKERGEHYSIYSTNYRMLKDSIYDYAYISYDKSEGSTNALLPFLNEEVDESASGFTMINRLANQVSTANDMVDALSKVFFYVGIVMAVFAALLLSNFISVSISSKTREIGILRAVGARSIDVFKIFFSESFVITLGCVILSIIGGFVSCSILNNMVGELIQVSLFVFGILSVVILVMVALLTTIIATIIPVYRAAKKKPVDSIRTF